MIATGENKRIWWSSYLADAVKALALTKFVFNLPGALFGLL